MTTPTFGKPYGRTPSFVTCEGVAVTMWRKGQRVQFFDDDGNQVGPEHRNVAPAVVAAFADGWIDPSDLALSVACILEVRANTVQR